MRSWEESEREHEAESHSWRRQRDGQPGQGRHRGKTDRPTLGRGGWLQWRLGRSPEGPEAPGGLGATASLCHGPQGMSGARLGMGTLTFVGPGLGRAGRGTCHFGRQPIHIAQVSQDSLELDPPALCGDQREEGGASARDLLWLCPSRLADHHSLPATVGGTELWVPGGGRAEETEACGDPPAPIPCDPRAPLARQHRT